MQLTEKNFCPNIKDLSTSLKLNYICKVTGKLCPKVDYSSGKALPSKLFIKNGCPLNKKEEEQIVEEVKKVKEEVKKTPTKKEAVQSVAEAIEEPIKEVVLEDIQKEVIEEVKKENTQQNKAKTNNYSCKKRSK